MVGLRVTSFNKVAKFPNASFCSMFIHARERAGVTDLLIRDHEDLGQGPGDALAELIRAGEGVGEEALFDDADVLVEVGVGRWTKLR